MTKTLSYYTWPILIIGLLMYAVIASTRMLYLASNSKSHFVSEQPYEDALGYQSVIDAKQRFVDAGLTMNVSSVKLPENKVKLSVKFLQRGQEFAGDIEGVLQLQYAKDPNRDLSFELKEISSGSQHFTLANRDLAEGLWLVTFKGVSGSQSVQSSMSLVVEK